MYRKNGWMIVAALVAGFGLGCGEAQTPSEPTGPAKGKADGQGCELGTYEFGGECLDPFQICDNTGGVMHDYGCVCPDAGYFKLALGCISGDDAQALCVGSEGAWVESTTWTIDQPGDQYLCECPAETALDDQDGQCKDWITMCQDTGGSAHDWGCNCGPDKTFYLGTGGCTDHFVAASICQDSGGSWGDVPGYDETMPGPAEVCTCLDIQYVSDWTGRCVLPQTNDCEETGGTEFDWGCFCGADSYYVPSEGGCIESPAAQALCEGSTGTWTETPNFEEASMQSPTERHYCACEDGYFETTEGVCKS